MRKFKSLVLLEIILSCALAITSCDSQKPNDTTQPNLTKEKEELLQKVYKINFELHGGKPPAENAIGSEEAIQNGSGADESQYHEIQLQPNKGENFVKMPADRMPKIPVHPDDQTRFDGWFTDAEYTQPFDIEKNITENITLHAKWVRYISIELLRFYPKDPTCISTSDAPCEAHSNATSTDPDREFGTSFYTEKPYLSRPGGDPFVHPNSILSPEHIAEIKDRIWQGKDFIGKWMTGPDCKTEFDFSKPVYDGLKIYECKFKSVPVKFVAYGYENEEFIDATTSDGASFNIKEEIVVENLYQVFYLDLFNFNNIKLPPDPTLPEKVFNNWYYMVNTNNNKPMSLLEIFSFMKSAKTAPNMWNAYKTYAQVTSENTETPTSKIYFFARFDDAP